MAELKKEWGFLHPCHAAGGAFYYPASEADAVIERWKFDADTTREAHICTHKRAEEAEGRLKIAVEALEKAEEIMDVLAEAGIKEWLDKIPHLHRADFWAAAHMAIRKALADIDKPVEPQKE